MAAVASPRYAGFWIRLLALMADVAILFVATLAILFVSAFFGKTGLRIGSIVALVLQSLYWPLLHASAGQASYGKAMLGLKVTDLDGGRISFARSCGRALAWIVSALPLLLGFVMAAFTARRQALHDYICSTCVVRDGPAHIAGAITVTVVGIVGPMIAIPVFFMAMFMGIVASLFGDLLGEMRRLAPQIQIQIPAPQAPKPQPPMQQPAPAPQPASSPNTGAPAPAGSDAAFDQVAGAPLTGLEKPGTTRAGPAILELSSFFSGSFWLKLHLPVPAMGEPEFLPSPRVTVNRVLDASGSNLHDAGNTFETKDFFRRVQLSKRTDPVPHLSGIRSVHVLPGASEQSVQRVEGRINLFMPAEAKVVAFEATETGKPKSVHDAALTLVSVKGGEVVLRYRGASENLLGVRAFGADGKPVAPESRQILPEKQNVDQEFSVSFKGTPARIEAVVAARLIEREFAFSLARGATAAPPGPR